MRAKILPFLTVFLIVSCNIKEVNHDLQTEKEQKRYKTENVIVLVIDGPRYTETWGDSTHQYQPRLANDLSKEGVIYSNFYNNGSTLTNPGHTAITTGNYQSLNNSGKELPDNPSIFQYWLKETQQDSSKAWIITSKDKLEVLANCKDSVWANSFLPSTNCGVGGNGLGNGYRHDSLTFSAIQSILGTHHPKMVLINFREPDYSGHANDWNAYINGIRDTDEYAYKVWKMIQSDPIYANKTTLFVTNDHGRHIDNHKDGFESHGDDCMGCRHINLFAAGPDFKQGIILDNNREQIDISATIAELMGFEFSTGKGKLMRELFER